MLYVHSCPMLGSSELYMSLNTDYSLHLSIPVKWVLDSNGHKLGVFRLNFGHGVVGNGARSSPCNIEFVGADKLHKYKQVVFVPTSDGTFQLQEFPLLYGFTDLPGSKSEGTCSIVGLFIPAWNGVRKKAIVGYSDKGIPLVLAYPSIDDNGYIFGWSHVVWRKTPGQGIESLGLANEPMLFLNKPRNLDCEKKLMASKKVQDARALQLQGWNVALTSQGCTLYSFPQVPDIIIPRCIDIEYANTTHVLPLNTRLVVYDNEPSPYYKPRTKFCLSRSGGEDAVPIRIANLGKAVVFLDTKLSWVLNAVYGVIAVAVHSSGAVLQSSMMLEIALPPSEFLSAVTIHLHFQSKSKVCIVLPQTSHLNLEISAPQRVIELTHLGTSCSSAAVFFNLGHAISEYCKDPNNWVLDKSYPSPSAIKSFIKDILFSIELVCFGDAVSCNTFQTALNSATQDYYQSIGCEKMIIQGNECLKVYRSYVKDGVRVKDTVWMSRS